MKFNVLKLNSWHRWWLLVFGFWINGIISILLLTFLGPVWFKLFFWFGALYSLFGPHARLPHDTRAFLLGMHTQSCVVYLALLFFRSLVEFPGILTLLQFNSSLLIFFSLVLIFKKGWKQLITEEKPEVKTEFLQLECHNCTWNAMAEFIVGNPQSRKDAFDLLAEKHRQKRKPGCGELIDPENLLPTPDDLGFYTLQDIELEKAKKNGRLY